MKQEPSAAGRLWESTLPLDVQYETGAGAGNKGCMASSTPPPVIEFHHPFPGGERKHLDDIAEFGGTVPK